MKRVLVTVLLLIASASAQNWTTVTATKLAYVDKSPIATGKFCVTATNDSDTAISFKTGDGEQIAKYTRCVNVTNGVAAALSVPNPATTAPQNIKYRIEVKDNSGVVLPYKGVYFTGTTFSFDEYVPNTTALKTGQTVDVLTVKDLTITTSCVGCGEGEAGAAGVASFNGRTGAVTPQTNDYSWSQIASKPSTFTPSTHNHTKSEVTDFPTTWAWGSLTGVPSTFTPSAHNQAFTTITGVLDLAQMPNCTVDGQVAKRVAGAWQCAADATGTGGASGVSSFNGATGDVTYAPAWNDVTSKPTEFTPAAHNQAISTITGLQTVLDGKQASGSYAAANASTTVNGQTCALGGSCTIDTGSSYPGCTSDGANGLECTGTIKAQSLQATGSAYINIAHRADSTTTGDFWRSNDNIKWRGASTTYTAATTADLNNYLATSALDATLIVGKFSGTGDYLKSDGTKGTPAGTSLPSQTGNSGKYLTTDGTNASWGTVSGAGDTWVVAAATPSFSPAAGTYTGTQSVTASCTSGTVYCSTGTTLVSCSGISVAASGSLYARCEEAGKKPTNATAAYTINAAAAVADPTFNPVAGTYSSTQSVTISTSTSGATICYTSDGSTPAATTPGTCSTGSTYSTPVSVAATSTLKALGTKSGSTNSSVTSAAYTISAGGGYSDSFTGTGSLSASWTSPLGGGATIAKYSGKAGTAAWQGDAFARYSGGTFASDQQVQGDINVTTAGDHAGVCIGLDASGNGYCMRRTDSGVALSKVTARSFDAAGQVSCGAATINVAVTAKLVRSGSTMTGYINGTQACQKTDSTFTDGVPGLMVNNGNGAAAADGSVANWSAQ